MKTKEEYHALNNKMAELNEEELEQVTGGAMTDEMIISKVISIFERVIGGANVKLNSNFRDLGAESLDIVDIVSNVEEEFGLKIPESEYSSLLGVESMVNCIRKMMR